MKPFIASIFLAAALLAGCNDDTETLVAALPDVNAENCKQENIQKIEPEDKRQEFAGQCLRRNSYKESEPKQW